MKTLNTLLDKAREVRKLPSDMALAASLGKSRALLSEWRKGAKQIQNEDIAQLCQMAQIDGPEYMAKINAERATSAAEKALWRAALDRLTPAVVAVGAFVILVSVGVLATSDDHVAVEALAFLNAVPLGIMRSIRTDC